MVAESVVVYPGCNCLGTAARVLYALCRRSARYRDIVAASCLAVIATVRKSCIFPPYGHHRHIVTAAAAVTS